MSTITPEQEATLRKNVVAKAASHVGETEQPLWSNEDHGGVIDRANLYVGNAPASEPAWCCAFACYCVGMSAAGLGLRFEDTLLEKTGYCPDEFNHAKAHGTAIDAHLACTGGATVEAGDLMLEWFDSLGGYHHAALVVTPPADGNPAFTTIEGNAVPDGYSNLAHENQGYGVFRRHRNASDQTGSGHNKYCFVKLV